MTTTRELYEAAKALVSRKAFSHLGEPACIFCGRISRDNETVNHEDGCDFEALDRAVLAYQPLRWTTDPPKEEGWYWYRASLNLCKLRVLRFQFFGGKMMGTTDPCEGFFPVENLIGEWCGPIQLPDGEEE